MMADSMLTLSTRFSNRHIHLGICGSVACYKACDLLRTWLKMGMHVSATLTPGAQKFISPLLLESLGALPVYGEMFDRNQSCFAHLEPGQTAHCMVVAPASANTLANIAHGNAADMLSAQALAFAGPMIVAPAMNPKMWHNPATQENIETIRRRGGIVVQPGDGGTACGDTGQGRLAPLHEIVFAACRSLCPQDMLGRQVMITLGPTREPWDDVRFWSNPSSGRMGTALALSAWLRGATVTAVCGPTGDLQLPHEIRMLRVNTAREMFEAASQIWPKMDIGIFSAAVADFSPEPIQGKKFKKSSSPNGFDVHFTPNPDILQSLAAHKTPGQKVLGFAAESVPDQDDLLALAKLKLDSKKADIIAANKINGAAGAFAADMSQMTVVDLHGRTETWPPRSKADEAWDLCTWLLEI